MWKKNSIFWDLPYWEVLEVRNTIDVMHLTKNLCVNLVGFLGVYGKPKDTLEARQDLQLMKQRAALHPEKRESMFECLNSIKLPSGYSLNIKRLLNMKEKKFAHVKSHDCNMLMTQLLPVALRGILLDNVQATIIKLYAFLNAIS
jgi:hypothetical protein